MRALLNVLLHPDRRRPSPRPLRVDLRKVLLAGMALWALGLIVTAILFATGHVQAIALQTCAAGLVLGCAGLVWERTHRRTYRNV